jgi:DNA-binding MarR family transcriptional regulator
VAAVPSTQALHHATELARLIGGVRRQLRGRVSRALAEVDQSFHDWQVLANVKWQGGMTQVELAEFIGAHPAGVSRLVDSLQRRGLVRRVADSDDRRCVSVHLTAKGEAWYERWHRVPMGVMHEDLSKLKAPEQAQLQRLLKKLLGPSPSR